MYGAGEKKSATAPAIALDAHVHLYPMADVGKALSSGHDNLLAAALASGQRPESFCLLLTETSRDDAFNALAVGKLAADGWEIRRVLTDAAALRAERTSDGATIFLLAGRQIVTAERIEVLGLATANRFSDGQPIRDVLTELKSLEIPALMPWGLGKWMGARGKEVTRLLSQPATDGLLLGDNAGRPLGWPTPQLFHKAKALGMPVLPGSDPLPAPGTEVEIGSFGCLIEGALDPMRPAEDLRARLFTWRCQPVPIGRRQAIHATVARQMAFRRHKRSVL